MSDEALRRLRPMVEREARRLRARLPANVELDDLVQAGWIGAADALARYDPAGGASLETYVAHRARGAMMDELRRDDPLTRDERRDRRALDAAADRLAQRLCRTPRRGELAAELGWTDERLRAAETAASLVALEEQTYAALFDADPLDGLLERERDALLQAELARLPGRPREVVRLVLDGDLTGHEIGLLFGVTGSRISQMTAAAAAQIRARLDALAEPHTVAAPPAPPPLSPSELAEWAGVRVG